MRKKRKELSASPSKEIMQSPSPSPEIVWSNLGKWDKWYSQVKIGQPSRIRYSNTIAYKLGADFLSDCEIVEDWGTGVGAFKVHRPDAIGIDGSKTPYADKIVDLAEYISDVDGIFMRHVLEHNYNWKKIVRNALASARKICIVIFTPFNEITIKKADNAKFGVDVPDLSLGEKEFFDCLSSAKTVKHEIIKTKTYYGQEIMVYIEMDK